MAVMINGTKWNLIISPKNLEFSSQYFTGTTSVSIGYVSGHSDIEKATALNSVDTASLKTQAANTKAAAQASLLTKNTAINAPVNASAAAAVAAPSKVSTDTVVRVGFDNRFDGKGVTDTMLATLNYDRMFKAAIDVKNRCNLTSAGGNSDWYIPSIYELNALYYAAKPEDTDSDSTSYAWNPMDVGPPDRTVSGYYEPAKQTKRRSFQIDGEKIGAHAFRTDIPYMSTTMNLQKTHVYTISFNNGAVALRPLSDMLLVRPIRRTSA